MKSLKSYMIRGAIFVSVLGTLLHFAYEFSGDNSIVALFAAINESTWEHMKLIFFPMLIFSIYACRKLNKEYPPICSAMAFGTLFGTILIPVLFYTYSGILGYNIAIVDISIFYISVILAFYTAYKSTLSSNMEKFAGLLIFLLLVVLILFFVFTTFPPNIPLFISP